MGKAYFVSNNVQIHVAKQCNDIGPRTVLTLNNVFKVMQNYTSITPPQKNCFRSTKRFRKKRGGGQKSEESRIIYILSRGAKNCKVLVKRDLQAQMINLL